MKKLFLILLFFVGLTKIIVAQSDSVPNDPLISIEKISVPPSTTLTQWQPSILSLEELAEETQVLDYFIRPPKTYTLNEEPRLPGTKLWAWKGPKRENQTYPHLMLMIMTPPEEEDKKNSAPDILNILLKGVENRRENWTQTEPETGLINGQEFVRIYWRGKDKLTGADMNGLMYVGVEGETIIQFASQDLVEHQNDLTKAENAILTFRR